MLILSTSPVDCRAGPQSIVNEVGRDRCTRWNPRDCGLLKQLLLAMKENAWPMDPRTTMRMGEEEEASSLLLGEPVLPSNLPNRTGNVWTAVAHIITAVIGSGVLSLAWSVAQLGWIGGPLALVTFAGVTFISAHLLSELYRSPDPDCGHVRNSSYIDAAKFYLGPKGMWICSTIQQINFCGSGIAYIITSASSMRAIHKSNCLHKYGHQATCSYGEGLYMLLFGGIQIFCSQIPNFHAMELLSFIAAAMSASYATIGLALGLAKIIGNGTIKGNIKGAAAATTTQKIWRLSEAIGDIAFGYSYSFLSFEIQDTLRSPPSENQSMKKASAISISVTTFFYLCCACFCYGAFGDDTPGNILTGFGFYEPYWLIDFANACVVLHLVGGYQVVSQPVFATVETWFMENFQNYRIVNTTHIVKAPLISSCKVNFSKLCFRLLYVMSTTGLAMLFPYFNQVLGVLGALLFWPLSIYFPVEMYLVQKMIQPWTKKWVYLKLFSATCLIVSLMALIGSFVEMFNAKFN